MPHLEIKKCTDSIGCRVVEWRLLGKVDQGESGWSGQKIGAENGDPNLRFQPRLPGSVVGEASMGQGREANKITQEHVLR